MRVLFSEKTLSTIVNSFFAEFHKKNRFSDVCSSQSLLTTILWGTT